MNEILDITIYLFGKLLGFLLYPFRFAGQYAHRLYHLFKAKATILEESAQAENMRTQAETKTPGRNKQRTKPRYSQMATPYVPGHLIAEAAAFPPVQPRLHPSERSVDDMPAFQEALDRAQAAFYEQEDDSLNRGNKSAMMERLSAVSISGSNDLELGNILSLNVNASDKTARRRKVTDMLGSDMVQPETAKRRRVIAEVHLDGNGSAEQRIVASARVLDKRKSMAADRPEEMTLRPTMKQVAKRMQTREGNAIIDSHTLGARPASRLPKRTAGNDSNTSAPTSNAVINVERSKTRQLARETAAAAMKLAREEAASGSKRAGSTERRNGIPSRRKKPS